MKANKHKINGGTIEKYMIGIIMIVVLFKVLANLFPTLTASGDALNSAGFPLGSLFVSGGAVWYILAAAVILLLFASFNSKK